MGLGSLIEGAKDLALFLKFRKRFKEDVMLKGFLTALYAASGFVVTGVMARLTMNCPDLAAAIGPAALAALGGAFTFYLTRPDKAAGRKSLLVGAVAAGWAAFQAQITTVCGAGFVEQLPTLVTAGAVVGLGLYLRSPKGPAAPTIDPKRFVSGIVALVALLGLTGCGSLAQVRVGGEPRPLGVDVDVVRSLVCQNEIEKAEDYVRRRATTGEAQVVEEIEKARAWTAGKPGCACREKTCVSLKDEAK